MAHFDIPLGLTFDDVLLRPAESDILPSLANTAVLNGETYLDDTSRKLVWIVYPWTLTHRPGMAPHSVCHAQLPDLTDKTTYFVQFNAEKEYAKTVGTAELYEVRHLHVPRREDFCAQLPGYYAQVAHCEVAAAAAYDLPRSPPR